MDTYLVVEKWKSSYENPITLFGGQEVIVDLTKNADYPEWDGWVWCVSADNSGWVPVQILTIVDETDGRYTASVNEDYTAKELTITPDEKVIGEKSLNGWLWCHKENQDSQEDWGWVPLRNLKKL